MATRTFNYTGASQSFVVPDQCTDVTIELLGAGGDFTSDGGTGGYVKGHRTVAPGDALYIFVGGAGNDQAGGFNGGARGGNASAGLPGPGGGGATDVRIGGTALANRIAVAGGGGGEGRGSGGGLGGDGGAATGQAGGSNGPSIGGGGGTAAAGGAGGTGFAAGSAGTLGTGGHGGDTVAGAGGGGGGGGYYGGGGAGSYNAAAQSGGGGGGSNYTGGLTTLTSSTRGGGSGGSTHGKAILTYNLAPNTPTVGFSLTNYDTALPFPVNIGYSDPDSSDALSKIDVRWRIGSGAWTTIAAIVPGASLVSSDGGASWIYSFAAHTFDAYVDELIEVQVQTYDSLSASSGWSASAYVTPRTAPVAATITSPVVGDTIDSRTPFIEWTTPVPMVRFQAAIFDAAGTTQLLTAPAIPVPDGSNGGVSQLPLYAYIDHADYQLGLRYQQVDGVWSPWALTGVLEANINSPLQPTLVLTPSNDTASVHITIVNPGGDAFPPLYNDVFRQNIDDGSDEIRIATNVATNGDYTDFTPGNRSSYRYRVNAVNATTYTSSE